MIATMAKSGTMVEPKTDPTFIPAPAASHFNKAEA